VRHNDERRAAPDDSDTGRDGLPVEPDWLRGGRRLARIPNAAFECGTAGFGAVTCSNPTETSGVVDNICVVSAGFAIFMAPSVPIPPKLSPLTLQPNVSCVNMGSGGRI
jgi:hypothetical protein